MNPDYRAHALMCRNLTPEKLEAMPLRSWERRLMRQLRRPPLDPIWELVAFYLAVVVAVLLTLWVL
jgi:hypothetical protein